MPSRSDPQTIRWPLIAQPVLRSVVRAPLDDRNFETNYGGGIVAIHLYDYRATMRLGRDTYQLAPGHLTITPVHTHASYHVPRPGTHLCVHMEPLPEPADEDACVALPLHVDLGDSASRVRIDMQRLIHLHAAPPDDRLSHTYASAALQQLMLGIALLARGDTPRLDASAGSRAVRRAADLIERHLRQTPTVPDLAAAVGLSQNYLARRFRETFGMTIPRFVLARRIELARQLLVTTDLSVGEIGRRVGMPDPQHFNKQFRLITGISPSTARSRGGHFV